MALVEVAHTPKTDSAVLSGAQAFVEALGKTAVPVLDSTGFVVNRLLVPYLTGAIAALEATTSRALVTRHLVLHEGEEVTGYVDLASERAYSYKDGSASAVTDLPETAAGEKADARYAMLEKLADYDDDLMEKLLEDQEPERDQVYGDLTREFQAGNILPVLLGAAEH